ncbi:hypothetical protein N566_00245 [Streptomycetaceae bacterium MP113-05]|nr:hypothetical protein N566_00245 [Streptomycetaceae bacterium MP113-05]
MEEGRGLCEASLVKLGVGEEVEVHRAARVTLLAAPFQPPVEGAAHQVDCVPSGPVLAGGAVRRTGVAAVCAEPLGVGDDREKSEWGVGGGAGGGLVGEVVEPLRIGGFSEDGGHQVMGVVVFAVSDAHFLEGARWASSEVPVCRASSSAASQGLGSAGLRAAASWTAW